EIGTMSPNLQTKLLRVLQEREFERIGDNRTTRIDVRVIAATNSELARMVKDGTFREDLYYRLNVIPIHLPPLRERLGGELDPPRTDVTMSQDALRRLMAYEWPGNIRQLENTIERALALGRGRSQIDVSALPEEIQASGQPTAPSALALPAHGLDLDEYV